MKQSDLDRQLRSASKRAAKDMGWKWIDGLSYWTIGPLFFVLAQTARAKESRFNSALRFKWLALDQMLWTVLDMADNQKAPFSLHANGAFVLMGQEILSISKQNLDWSQPLVNHEVAAATQQAAHRAHEVAAQITSINAYLAFLQQGQEALMLRHPQAATNVWKETLLVAMVNGDLDTAAQIARARMTAGDTGGFLSEGKSFYVCALEACTSKGRP